VSVNAEIRCKEVVELLSDYLDGRLPEPERVRVEEHLRGCDGCTTILEGFRETIRLTGMLTVEAVSEPERVTLLDAFRDWTETR
jgi:anti-sigma factor RsiW